MPALEICDDTARWDAFVRGSPQGSVFATGAFLDSVATSVDRVLWRDGEKILAAAPILLDEDSQSLTEPARFSFYQGMLLDKARGRRRFRQNQQDFIVETEFLAALAERYSRFCLSNSWTLKDLRPFQWHNFDKPENGHIEVELKYTGLLDLGEFDGFEDYLPTIAKTRRQQLKRAKCVFEAIETDDIDLFLDIHDSAFAGHGIELPPETREYRRRIISDGLNGGYGRLVAARHESGTIAAIYFWVYDWACAYHLFAANEPAFRPTHGSTFLLLEMIREAFDRKFKRVDFCGLNAPGHGDYKISFNCEPKPFFVTTFCHPAGG